MIFRSWSVVSLAVLVAACSSPSGPEPNTPVASTESQVLPTDQSSTSEDTPEGDRGSEEAPPEVAETDDEPSPPEEKATDSSNSPSVVAADIDDWKPIQASLSLESPLLGPWVLESGRCEDPNIPEEHRGEMAGTPTIGGIPSHVVMFWPEKDRSFFAHTEDPGGRGFAMPNFFHAKFSGGKLSGTILEGSSSLGAIGETFSLGASYSASADRIRFETPPSQDPEQGPPFACSHVFTRHSSNPTPE